MVLILITFATAEHQLYSDAAHQLYNDAASKFWSTARVGSCVQTVAEGDCWEGNKGVLPLPLPRKHGFKPSSQPWAAACIEACRGCPRCRFISLSTRWKDCSWSHSCNLSALDQSISGFHSGQLPGPEFLPKVPSPPPLLATSPSPPPLPEIPKLPSAAHAFQRATWLSMAQLRRGMQYGDTSRIARKLRTGQPLTISTIGASNTVRGGCEVRQGGKCASSEYTARDDDGSPHGWLMQVFEAVNRTWPHPENRLVNRGMMATGPQTYAKCVDKYVPPTADVVLISFADMCAPVKEHWAAETVRESLNSTFGWSIEAITRQLLRRPDPPAVAFFNIFKWTDFWLGTGSRELTYSMECDAMFSEIASFYRVSVVSMRNALWHAVHPRTPTAATRPNPYRWQTWTTDSGRHLDLGRGDRMAAELFYFWLRGAVEYNLPDAALPVQQMRWLSEYPHHGAIVRGRTSCFSFDDDFGGAISRPRVVNGSAGWSWVEWVAAAGGQRKHKPGYVASARGARLLLDTQTAGAQRISVGYLRTYSSSAVARAGCESPCVCTPDTLHAHTSSHTSTTQMSTPLEASTPPGVGTCTVYLQLETDGQQFKLNSLQVESL